VILQDPTLLRSALAAALEAARASDAGQQALPLPPPPEPPPLSPAAARRAAAAARIHQAPRTAPAGTGARASSPRRRSGPRITDLHDLGAVARQLREEQARLEAQAKERRAAAARREAEHQLFSRAVGAIRPLRTRERLHLSDPPPLPLPVQHWLDEERVLRESISDDFDVSTLLDTDDQLSFRRPGIGVEITQRLRAGHWSIQRQLDLHGLRVDEAREALGQFIRNAHKNGMRCVRVVHGKGLGSPGKSPVLKSRVQRWLVQKSEVLAFVQARPMDGGAGALLVLLQPVGTRQ
jgi:DNA-nicking Smr family endonuclease